MIEVLKNKNFAKDFVAETIFFVFKISESLLESSLRLYIYQELCLKFSNFEDKSICRNLSLYPKEENDLQTQAAFYLTLYRLLVNLPALFLCAFCGSWSDRVGRKHPIVISSLSSIVGVIFFLINCNLPYQFSANSLNASHSVEFGNQSTIHYHGDGSIYKEKIIFLTMMFFGSLFRGLSGKGSIVTMAVHSYVSDNSDKTTRTARLGCLLSMNFFGLFVGSLIVGIFLEGMGFNVVFSIVIFLHVICIVLAVAFMDSMNGKDEIQKDDVEPEKSVENADPPDKKVESKDSRTKLVLFHWRNLYDFFLILKTFPSGRVVFFFLVIVIQQACKSGEIDVTLLFTMKAPLSWKESIYGYFLATDYACLGVATSALLPLLIKVFKTRDMSLAIIGIAFKIVRLVMLAVSTSTWAVFLSAILGCPSALIISCLKSLISKSFHERDLGKIFALLSGCETFSNLIGNVIFNYLYVATLSFYAGFIFCLDSFIFLVLLLCSIYLGCTDDKVDDQETPLCQTSTSPIGSEDYGTLKEKPQITLEDESLKTLNN